MCLMCPRNIPRNSRLCACVCVRAHHQEPANADVLSVYNRIDLIQTPRSLSSASVFVSFVQICLMFF